MHSITARASSAVRRRHIVNRVLASQKISKSVKRADYLRDYNMFLFKQSGALGVRLDSVIMHQKGKINLGRSFDAREEANSVLRDLRNLNGHLTDFFRKSSHKERMVHSASLSSDLTKLIKKCNAFSKNSAVVFGPRRKQVMALFQIQIDSLKRKVRVLAPVKKK